MPFMRSSKKPAFKHNVEVEMKAHPDKPKQDLAIAYSIKRNSMPKKMAQGGLISAKMEKRPMPSDMHNDASDVAHNSAKAPPRKGDSAVTGEDISYQAHNKPKLERIKHPKLVAQSAYTARLRDQEDDLMKTAAPAPYAAKPNSEYDEASMKHTSPSPDMALEHSTKRKPYAKGGEVEASDYDMPLEEAVDHQDALYDDEKHLMASASPSMDEGDHDAHMHNEEHPDRHGPMPHEDMYADGGEVSDYHDMDMQPLDEAQDEHEDSISAAIMANRQKFARGGAILSEDSMESHDSDMADLDRNAQEDANMEDKASFDALRKENYAEGDALDQLDQPHDSNLIGDERESQSENMHSRNLIDKIRNTRRMR